MAKSVSLHPEKIRNILLIKLRNIGDVVLTTPLIRVLHEAFPQANICYLVSAESEAIVKHHPLVHKTFIFDRQRESLSLQEQFKRQWRLLREIRQQKFDLAVNLTEGDRGGFLSLWSQARWRVGYNKRKFFQYLFYNVTVAPEKAGREQAVVQNFSFLKPLAIPLKKKLSDIKLEVHSSPDSAIRVHDLLRHAGIDNTPFIHCHPTSRWLFKCWKESYWGKTLDNLQHEFKIPVVITCGPVDQEKKMVEKIIQSMVKPAIHLAGQLNLDDLMALSSQSLCFVGVDSAPMHIAAAYGKKICVLFGPTNNHVWAPWGTDYKIIAADFACRPCERDGCFGAKKSLCLEELRPEHVIPIMKKMIQEVVS